MLTEEERKARQKEADRRRYLKNPEKRKEFVRKWRNANIGKKVEYDRKRWLSNRDKYKERIKIWKKNHPERVKEMDKKKQYKRRRELGFIPLNSHFKGSHAHHVDTEKIVYIPEFIHKQHPHNHNKPETMKEINKFAFNYLFGVVQQVKLF